MVMPELYAEPLAEDRIKQLVEENRSVERFIDSPFIVQVYGKYTPGLIFWQNGQYKLEDNHGGVRVIEVSEVNPPVMIQGPWNVKFPEGSGAPESIAMKYLESLHRHDIPGVKYFSGTAVYSINFKLESGDMAGERRLFLDLGRVEVIAEVILNGIKMGVLWTRPYQTEITHAAKSGINELVIRVVTLWPNRLIGDEQLPPEYVYEEVTGDMGASIARMPEWYLRGEPKPRGQRVAFSVWKHYQKDDPLLESGLLGPVVIKSAIMKALT
jgi:hypothetical protein